MPIKLFRTKLSALVVAVLIGWHPVVTVWAQSGNGTQTAGPDSGQGKVLPPAYNEEMLRLSEILGALHYIRELCGANEGQLWRKQMEDLLQKEEPTPERRAELIAHFNRGFRGFQSSYRDCTPAAVEANDRYMFEGARLAGLIGTRYGR